VVAGSRSRSEETNFSFVPLSCHDSLNRNLGELVYDHGSGGPSSVGGGAAPEEDSEEEDYSDQEEEQDGGGAPPEQFDGNPELPGLGEGGSGVYSPAGWGDVPEEDDEEGGPSEHDDEQDMYGTPPVPPEDALAVVVDISLCDALPNVYDSERGTTNRRRRRLWRSGAATQWLVIVREVIAR
jgi:hypothetical protein